MAVRTRRLGSGADTWAGFVDALSTLLVVLIFALVVFMLAQFFQGLAITGRDEALARLESHVAELADMLALERDTNADMRLELTQLATELRGATSALDDAEQALAVLRAERDGLVARLSATEDYAAQAGAELDDARTGIGLLQADLDRALEDVAVTGDTLSLKLAEIASLRRDIDALGEARDNLEAEIGRMALLLEEARALRLALERDLAGSRASAAELERELAAAAAEIGEREAGRLEQLDEIDRLVLLLEDSRARRAATETRLSGTEAELEADRARIDALLADLGAERDRAMALEAELSSAAERTLLAQSRIEERDIRLAELARLVAMTEEEREAAEALSGRSLNQIALLNQQLGALRGQIAAINELLDAAEAQAEVDRVQIADLGSRLNAALAAKVQELSRYRSAFLERLVDMLGNRSDIKVVGDRFVLQSELLFDSGSAEISDEGRGELDKISSLLLGLVRDIPEDVDWILRVDGHTDTVPISTPQFPTNWELSTGRAISVVRYLVAQGVPEQRLAAAGFGEFQPIDPGDDEIALRRNRRIEFKLTER